jgi:hypothetical protein
MDTTERFELSELGAAPATADAGSDTPGYEFATHVEQRTVVLSDLRVLYLPMPKAGCTSVLWALAKLAGIPAEAFERSTWPGVVPALTVHDMRVWGVGHRLADYSADERERILGEEGWFRFSIVRHPAPRLWSAWQSKLLLREPRFLSAYGDEPWFPRVPERPEDILEDFRRFVAAVGTGDAVDVHWAVQHDLARQLPLTHVGRLESLGETLALLQAHVPALVWSDEEQRENRSPLPMPSVAYDEAAAAVLHDVYRADFDHYGYDLVSPGGESAEAAKWGRRVEPLVPLLRDTIEKHVRIGQLYRLARRVQTLEKRVEAASARQVGQSKSPLLTNLEGHTGFNVQWRWADGHLEPGFTAVVRAKNEARTLPSTLPPLLRAARHVILVDNGSTDGTTEVARAAAADEGAEDRLDIRSYPFSVARCGEEHLATPAASVHSLAYFYNWSFSHVHTRYALKWDADMVLTDVGVNALRDLAWQLEASDAVVKIPRYPLYVADERHAFLDLGLANCEPWAWPNRPGYSFVKAMEWEQPLLPPDVPRVVLPDWSCIELKHLDADEFAHWSDTDFDQTSRTQRKRREWEVFHALAEGGEPPADLVAVEAPAEEHVVEYVRSTWLPEQSQTLAGRAERMLARLLA